MLWSHTGKFMRLLIAESRSTAGLFIPLSASLWNDLVDSVFDGVGLAGFKSRANVFLLTEAASSFFVFCCFPFHYFLSIGRYCGAGSFRLIGCKSLSYSLTLPTSLNINTKVVKSINLKK